VAFPALITGDLPDQHTATVQLACYISTTAIITLIRPVLRDFRLILPFLALSLLLLQESVVRYILRIRQARQR
jgi:hypothetical protein